MSISKIKRDSITADAVNETKIADNAISEEHLDATVITGNTELAEAAAGTDVLLVYDASAGTLKKIQASNVGLQAPTVSSVSPTSVVSGDGTGNYTFTITGTGFLSGNADLINDSGTTISFDTVTIDSATQITGVIAKSSLPGSGEPYDVRVTSTNGLRTTLENQINIDQSPTFVTASGSLGSDRFSMSGVSVNATDPESAGNVTFELQSGTLPPGISIVNTAAEGGTATFTGTFSSLETSDTVYNFTLRAVDAASNTSSRSFSFTAQGPQYLSFTTSGTFTVPTGLSSVDVLVVGAGGGVGNNPGPGGLGGGGAGGLIFVPSFPITPGTPISVTVGCGAAGSNGQDSVFETLTAKGGGYGGSSPAATPGGPGGSGGGGRGGFCGQSGYGGGPATQPTQPGNSGAYGFGNSGGAGGGGPSPSGRGEGGSGGGAGASGQTGNPSGATGGIGRAYTIADGTTPVYYAGGGGGGASITYNPANGSGGQGGGGNAGPWTVAGQAGQANKGGGGGATGLPCGGATSGGKGIVIVKY